MINQNPADELKEQIELGYALKRLETNDDFKKVIIQGYIEKTLLEDSIDILDPTRANKVIQDIISVNNLKNHLQFISTTADNSIEDLGEVYES